jgi:hypothetical protein
MMASDGATRVAVNSALRAVPRLVETSKFGMHDQAVRIGEEIAALLETAMPSVSERIRKAAAARRGLTPLNVAVPQELLKYAAATGGFDGVVLPESVLREARMIVDEHRDAAKLAAFDVFPRHKIILHGPPGNGKTMLARAVGEELGLPVFELSFGHLVASHLGETGKNLEKVFDFVATADCVLFIDEFDTIGASRTTENDTGEMRRITNQMLLKMDRLDHRCVLIAATNLHGMIDPALARRFEIAIEVPAPTPDLVRRCALRELEPARTPGHDRRDLAERIVVSNPSHLSETVEMCRWIRRDLCLNGGENVDSWLASRRHGVPV